MLALVRKLFALFSPREKREALFMLVAFLLNALVDVAGVASIMPFMAVVANPEVIETNRWLKEVATRFNIGSHREFLLFLGFALLGLMVLSNGFKALMTWWTLRFDNRLNYALAHRLLAQYLARPYDFFLNHNTSDMGKNVLAEVRVVIAGVLSAAMLVLSNMLVAVLILTLLLVVQPTVALTIVVVLAGTYSIVYFLARQTLKRIGPEQVNANSMKFKAASEALSGIKDLKILGRERMFLDRFAQHAMRHAENNVKAGLIAQIPRHVLEVVSFGGILLIVLYLVGTNMDSGASVSLLALYAFAGYRLLPAIQQIFAGISGIRVDSASLDILHRDLAQQGNVSPDALFPKRTSEPAISFAHMIELKDLEFRYPGSDEPTLRGIDFRVPCNVSVGLVGATGSGKTTLVDIILGLLQPTSGTLRVDGVDITAGNVRQWQQNLGYVPQSIFLSDDTIASNIAFGVPEAEIDRAAVLQAARIANLDHFVLTELPQGYETVIGERGIRLSGGQRQRIGIARALYRDPAVLIMDEATSALDGVTEEAVMDALRTLSGEKTIIMIAHRLTTVRECAVIHQIEHGRVVASGTYAELERSSSWFRAAARSPN